MKYLKVFHFSKTFFLRFSNAEVKAETSVGLQIKKLATEEFSKLGTYQLELGNRKVVNYMIKDSRIMEYLKLQNVSKRTPLECSFR